MQTGSLKPMIFEDLTEVYREEKNKGLLTEVRSDLYSAMSRLLVTLRDDYDRLLSEDPDSIMCEGASHRRRRASRLVRDVISMRMNKISSLALRAASGANVATDILTEEEKVFYNSVLEAAGSLISSIGRAAGNVRYKIPAIENAAKSAVRTPPAMSEDMTLEDMPVVDDVSDDGHVPDVDDMHDFDDVEEAVPEDDVPEEKFFQTRDIPEEGPGKQENIAEEMISSPMTDDDDMDCLDEEECVLIRILEDLQEFAGPDRNYNLKKEELVTMPKSMADILVMRDKAVKVKLSP